jgi:hypothetical protein
VLANAQSSDTVFTTCLRLFRHYPLAVRRHYAEHRYGSMVLMNRDGGKARFYVLIMEWDDLFVLRPWDRRDGGRVEITPNEPVPGDVRRVIDSSMPIPRDGALLGWVTELRVCAVLAAYGRLLEPWEDPSAVPGLLTLPLAGTKPAEWPPGSIASLEDDRLWGYISRGQLADLGPLVSSHPGYVFWVPGTDARTGRSADESAEGPDGRQVGGRIVVTERMSTERFWLLAGVYTDHRTLREGTSAPPVRDLLATPGVTDLARGH